MYFKLSFVVIVSLMDAAVIMVNDINSILFVIRLYWSDRAVLII